MDFMSGEDRMYYLDRMWDLYFEGLYNKVKKSVRSRKKILQA